MASYSVDSIAALETRVRQLEARIASLEGQRGQRIAGSRPDYGPHAGSARVMEPASSIDRNGDLETLLGLTWFNRVGAALLIVALVLAAVWANDQGYLSPLLRNALGGLAALAIFVLGLRQSLSQGSGAAGALASGSCSSVYSASTRSR